MNYLIAGIVAIAYTYAINIYPDDLKECFIVKAINLMWVNFSTWCRINFPI